MSLPLEIHTTHLNPRMDLKDIRRFLSVNKYFLNNNQFFTSEIMKYTTDYISYGSEMSQDEKKLLLRTFFPIFIIRLLGLNTDDILSSLKIEGKKYRNEFFGPFVITINNIIDVEYTGDIGFFDRNYKIIVYTKKYDYDDYDYDDDDDDYYPKKTISSTSKNTFKMEIKSAKLTYLMYQTIVEELQAETTYVKEGEYNFNSNSVKIYIHENVGKTYDYELEYHFDRLYSHNLFLLGSISLEDFIKKHTKELIDLHESSYFPEFDDNDFHTIDYKLKVSKQELYSVEYDGEIDNCVYSRPVDLENTILTIPKDFDQKSVHKVNINLPSSKISDGWDN